MMDLLLCIPVLASELSCRLLIMYAMHYDACNLKKNSRLLIPILLIPIKKFPSPVCPLPDMQMYDPRVLIQVAKA